MIPTGELGWVSGTPERLIGSTKLVAQHNWVDRAVMSPRELEMGLRALDFPEEEMHHALAVSADAGRKVGEFASELAALRERDLGWSYFETPDDVKKLLREQSSVYERVRQWFKRWQIRIHEVEERTVRVPLFLLAAPKPDGCAASFEQGAM